MSYDLEFYFRTLPTIIPQLPDAAITLDGPRMIEREEIPDGYRRLLSGCKYSLTVCVSGTARETFDELERIKASLLSTYANAIVIDNQSGKAIVRGKEVELPRPSGGQQRFTSIALWFEDGAGFEAEKFDAFIDLIGRYIPKALPRSYGPIAGPMSKLAETGLGHFKRGMARQARPALVRLRAVQVCSHRNSQ